MKMYLLSDNIDTQRGMRLAGVEGTVVHTHEDVKKALGEILSDREIGILLVAEKLSAEFPDLFRDIKMTNQIPLIVDIPDRHGSDALSAAISEYVREAVGIKL